MYTRVIIVAVFSVAIKLDAVPPEACFANFRWEDCGAPPIRVLYYWKPGSRCEVGIWRGCLPSMNMFKDEYECVQTCIFTSRAEPQDYHALLANDILEETTFVENATNTESTTTGGDVTNNTEVVSNTGGDDGISATTNTNSATT